MPNPMRFTSRPRLRRLPPPTASNRVANPKLRRNGNVISTGRYDITIERDKVRIFDKETQTWTEAWGDPHLTTGDGDRASFTRDNITLQLQDGTKITIAPTELQGDVSYLDAVAIIKDGEAVIVDDLHGAGGPRFGDVRADVTEVDDAFADGTVLVAGHEVDDLFYAADRSELKGEDPTARWNEHDLDGKGGLERLRQDVADAMSKPFVKASGDLYARLFAVLARLNQQTEDQLDQIEQYEAIKDFGKKTGDLDEMKQKLSGLDDQLAELRRKQGTATSDSEKADLKRQIDDISVTRNQLSARIDGGREGLERARKQLLDQGVNPEDLDNPPANIDAKISEVQFRLQQTNAQIQETLQLVSNLQKTQHDTNTSIIQNLRS